MTKKPNKATELLLLNYVVDENDSIFSHQAQILKKLSHHFSSVYVFTNHLGLFECPDNVNIFVVPWTPKRRLLNVLRFVYKIYPFLIFKRNLVVFSHMTEVKSFLIFPITKILKIKHYLWYAHASKSKYLKFLRIGITGFITSTSGSFPFSFNNLYAIGQSIDPVQFPYLERNSFPLKKFVHIGRLDPSKNIEELIDTVLSLNKCGQNMSLTFIGKPSASNDSYYLNSIKTKYDDFITEGTIKFLGSISRDLISFRLSQFDVFIHAFEGSLDKVLVEATFTGIPVITSNQEYIKSFGSWALNYLDLNSEILAFKRMSLEEIKEKQNSRLRFALMNHNMDNWIAKLISILKAA